MEKITFCLFADLHYKKGMYIPTTADLASILDRAVAEHAAFCIHCGDFCNDYTGSPELIALYENAPMPMLGVYGNHELESANNHMATVTPHLCHAPTLHLHWGTPDGTIGDGTTAYYYFDIDPFRFICLDTNYSLTPDGAWEHNRTASYGPPSGNTQGNSLSPTQCQWLEGVLMDAAERGKRCLVFSHDSFAGLWGVSPDGETVRTLFRAANARRQGTVIAAYNGHYHTDHAAVVEDVFYMDVNTVRNNLWLPTRDKHYESETFRYIDYDASGKEIGTYDRLVSSLWMAENTWFSTAPLSAMVTVTLDEGRASIEVIGSGSTWYGEVVPTVWKDGKGPRITSQSVQLP